MPEEVAWSRCEAHLECLPGVTPSIPEGARRAEEVAWSRREAHLECLPGLTPSIPEGARRAAGPTRNASWLDLLNA
jgi:hypothetical protein